MGRRAIKFLGFVAWILTLSDEDVAELARRDRRRSDGPK